MTGRALKDVPIEQVYDDLREIFTIYSLVKGIKVTPESIDLCVTYITDRFYEPDNLDKIKEEVNKISVFSHAFKFSEKMKEEKEVEHLTKGENRMIIVLLESGPDSFREKYKEMFGEEFWDFSKELRRNEEMERNGVSDLHDLKEVVEEKMNRYIQ